MTAYRVTTPVLDYNGQVGDYQFAHGKFDGDITVAAETYFRAQGYGLVPLAEALKSDAQAVMAQAKADKAAADQAAADQAAAEKAAKAAAEKAAAEARNAGGNS